MEDLFYRAHNTVLDMCKDRLYHLKDVNDPESLDSLRKDPGEFHELYQQDKVDIVGIVTTDDKPVYIKFNRYSDKFATVDNLRAVFEPIKDALNLQLSPKVDEWNLNMHKIILIYDVGDARSKLQTFERKYERVGEFHDIKSMGFNIMKHIYQPKFSLLSDQEKIDLYRLIGRELLLDIPLSQQAPNERKFILAANPS